MRSVISSTALRISVLAVIKGKSAGSVISGSHQGGILNIALKGM